MSIDDDPASEGSVDVYVVGLGIVGVRQITPEVDDALTRCHEVFLVDSGFGVREHLQTRCEKVTDLVPVTYREDEPRLDAYDRMSTAVLEAALDHPPVAFAVYGHPLIYVYPSMQLQLAADALGLRIRVLPGISALDAVLVDIGLDPGLAGLQMYEATDVLMRDRYLQPDVPCLLWQLGAVETVLHSTAPSTPARFRRLQDHLLRFYPPAHEVHTVFSAPHPLAPSRVTSFALSELTERAPAVPHGATLYIPPSRIRPVLDPEIDSTVASTDHLRRLTRRAPGSASP